MTLDRMGLSTKITGSECLALFLKCFMREIILSKNTTF